MRDIQYKVVALLLLFSVYSDLKYAKIRNLYVLLSILAAVIINTGIQGISGVGDTLKGIALPIILLGFFFHARLLGAGDIKLFSAIGALLGWNFVLGAMANTFIAAGAVCLVLLIKQSKLKRSFVNFYRDTKLSFLLKRWVYAWGEQGRHTFKLSPVIAFGTVLQATLKNF